ncbi:hypothetical protein SAMN05661012_02985 [Chitinophaga sancti]|nr:hypothetical protein SAMN05661012_02985 [Chitinophaga sancti]
MVLCLLALQPSFAQSLGNIDQREVATNFMEYVQDGRPDRAATLLDQTKVKYDDHLKSSMKGAAESIRDVAEMTIPAVTAMKTDSTVFFRCRYYAPRDKFPDYYQVDIQFANENSLKISKLIFYDRATLVKMQTEKKD